MRKEKHDRPPGSGASRREGERDTSSHANKGGKGIDAGFRAGEGLKCLIGSREDESRPVKASDAAFNTGSPGEDRE